MLGAVRGTFFGQLTGQHSLRDLVTALDAGRSKLQQVGLGAVSRSTLLAIIGKRIFLDFRRPATGHANLVSGVGSAEMDRSSG